MIQAVTWHAVVAALWLLPSVAAHAGEAPRRQLGAHQHGHGRMSLAIEGDKVEIELRVPGMDIVGFEHEAATAEQKAAVEAARGKLVTASTVVRLPEAASCKQIGGEVDMAGEHDDDHVKGHEERSTAKVEHDHAGGEGHSEIRAEYWLVCAAPAALTAIEFVYFNTFAGSSELEVEVVTGKGGSKFEVSRDKPRIDLTGLM